LPHWIGEKQKFCCPSEPQAAVNIGLVIREVVVNLAIPQISGFFSRTMILANLLSVGQILPDMQAVERRQAIEEIVAMLVESGRIADSDKPELLDALKQREETMSTGIGFGIAIPHASSVRVTEVVAGFGRSKAGIEFDSLDNEPVHFIVLFVVPRDQFQTHLRTLAAIAKFLNDRTVREELANATDAASLLSVFENRTPKS